MPSQESIALSARRIWGAEGRLLRIVHLGLALFVFFLGLELMGSSFRILGKDVAATLISATANPLVGLCAGILATSLVQSSSTVTALVVSIVAGGGLTVEGAIPIVVGANLGTSVTNTIVSLGHVTRRDEFRLATAGATVHDIFNLLTVAILLPLELSFGILSRPALWLAGGMTDIGAPRLLNPVTVLVRPVADVALSAMAPVGWLVPVVGAGVLFAAIRYLLRVLRKLTIGASAKSMHSYLLGAPWRALLVGVTMTVMVQSSSITTSLAIPLVAAGIVSVTQIFPFVIGANIGTTITAMMAALALASGGSLLGLAALEVACAHLCFNLFGAVLFFPFEPLRRIPVRLATAFGRLAARNRFFALAYIGALFFVIPLLVLAVTQRGGPAETADPVEIQQTLPADSTVAR